VTNERQDGWLPVDCHAHTTFSDGELGVAELLERARERGVRASVSDHISSYMDSAVTTVNEVRAYLDALDEYDVLRGGEFCWHDSLWRALAGSRIVSGHSTRSGCRMVSSCMLSPVAFPT